MDSLSGIKERYAILRGQLDERARRLLVAAESQSAGWGGISTVSRATGVSRIVIREGIAELKKPKELPLGRIRRAGGGRKKATERDPTLKADLEELLEATTRGDPMSPLRWTCRSVRNLEAELKSKGHLVSHQVVADLLHEMEYSLQANNKTKEGGDHPDRNAQFEYLNEKVKRYLSWKEPRHLRRHKEEGIGGGLQERRKRIAAEGKSRRGAGPRFSDSGIGARQPIRDL